MGTRRPPSAVSNAREWQAFLEDTKDVVTAAGLPRHVLASEKTWLEFLEHGFISDDPIGFDVEQLTQAQYTSLVRLTERYFVAGHTWFTPIALHPTDQQALSQRYAPAS